MITNYFILDDIFFHRLQKLNNKNLYEEIENILDNEDMYIFCDIDNIADFLFSVISLKEKYNYDVNKEYLRQIFIFGYDEFEIEEFCISYMEKENIQKILKEIETINIKEEIEEKRKKEKLILEDLKKFGINIYEEENILLDEVELSFNQLKDFYNRALKENKNILIIKY